MLIFDALGNEKTQAWLDQKYGNVQHYPLPPGPAWRLFALCEDADETEATPAKTLPWWPATQATAAIVVKTLADNGSPLPGVPVARYWPGAPDLPPDRRHWQNKGVVGWTNVDGDTGFGMGPGDYYNPPAQEGASWAWIAQADVNTEAVAGLGMLAGTNHSHMNAVFTWDPGDEPPPPPDDDLLAIARSIRDTCLKILEALAK